MDDASLSSLIADHLDRHPEMLAQDLYLLLHQAALGPGHQLTIPHLAFEALTAEVQSLDLHVLEWEDTTDTLDPATNLARIHLRPYLRAGGSLSRLHDAVVETAELLHSQRATFPALLAQSMTTIQTFDRDHNLDDYVGFSLRDLQRTIAAAAREDHPPPQHSKDYVDAYSPAYRVAFLSAL